MKKYLITSFLILGIYSCGKPRVVEIQNHTIIRIKKNKMWNTVTQRFELKSFAILDDSSEVRVTDRSRVGDAIKYIFIK